ncbi:MAG: sialate O-acetylesterase, partial [Bacteroidaceae bacterium]|nr:sialate O-acetylesterase [Bacteroidaceae bacterium]
LKAGENTIYIRLKSYGGTPTFVTEKPYKLIPLDKGQNWEIDLSTGWEHQLVQRMPSPQGAPDFMMTPAALYKGMLAPVLNWGYKGAVWYQGESNVGRANEYETMLRLLISDWRGRLAATQTQPLPFVIIQLANFLHPQSPDQSAQQALRNAQRRVAETTPDCDWVYTGDLGEWNDIHPLQKKEVGERVQAAFDKLLKK